MIGCEGLHDGSEQTLKQIIGNEPRADLRFGVDHEGEVYIIAKRTGEIFRLVPREIDAGNLYPDDGLVGIEDLNIVLGNWNQHVPAHDPSRGDPSGDGFVGIDDLNFVLANWNNGTPPTASTNIPEPSTIALMAMGCLATIRKPKFTGDTLETLSD